MIHRIFLLLQIGALAQAERPTATNEHTHVTYLGSATEDGKVEQFMSIKYGQDTSDQQRFRPPLPFTPESGSLIDATKPGAACPQPEKPMKQDPWTRISNISEDCLNLRVSRPAIQGQHTKLLPVMVWIHGGGHMVGTIYDSAYDPVGLVRESIAGGSPVIYVAMNYRVNIFGFAISDSLLEDKFTNLGLRDQALALNWVRENIATFGGDPELITVFGEDTGASDIGLHLLTGGDDKKVAPFHRVVSQSGSALSVWSGDGKTSRASFATLAAKIGCISASPQYWYTVNCLRQFSMEQITQIAFEVAYEFDPVNGFHAFGPIIDGEVVPEDPSKAFKEGRFVKDVEMLFGWDMDEGSMDTPVAISTSIQAAAWLMKQHPHIPYPAALELVYLYLDGTYAERGQCHDSVTTAWCALSRLVRDITIVCPALRQASHMSLAGVSNIYLYELNQSAFAPMLSSKGRAHLGVSHFSDVPYIFNNLETSYYVNEERDLKLASWMSRAWSRFATFGSPGDADDWATSFGGMWKAEEPRQIVVRTLGGPNAGVRSMAFAERRKCVTVDRIFAEVTQH